MISTYSDKSPDEKEKYKLSWIYFSLKRNISWDLIIIISEIHNSDWVPCFVPWVRKHIPDFQSHPCWNKDATEESVAIRNGSEITHVFSLFISLFFFNRQVLLSYYTGAASIWTDFEQRWKNKSKCVACCANLTAVSLRKSLRR